MSCDKEPAAITLQNTATTTCQAAVLMWRCTAFAGLRQRQHPVAATRQRRNSHGALAAGRGLLLAHRPGRPQPPPGPSQLFLFKFLHAR